MREYCENIPEYHGQLGAIYSPSETIFKLFSPQATAVKLHLKKDDRQYCYPLQREHDALFSLSLSGDFWGFFYSYEIESQQTTYKEVVDPYAMLTSVNGAWGVVCDLTPRTYSYQLPNHYNPLIYEMSVRDFTSSQTIKNPGTFKALSDQSNLDYLYNLGITHVQLLPIFDFSATSVDDTDPFKRYNWGYDPQNFNSIKGAFATNPYDPFVKHHELQQMIESFHSRGIGVIMDVVYNHVFNVEQSPLFQTAGDYFFRKNEQGEYANGTACGNELASERVMVRKFILDSLKHWAKTYRFDGFRFDLMGVLDIETMKQVSCELRKINPHIVLLGEGWDLGALPKDKRATQHNADKLPQCAFFNDSMRDALRGDVFIHQRAGFVSGTSDLQLSTRVLHNILGARDIYAYQSPSQVVQYVEAHDNLTLFDKLQAVENNANYADLLARHKLATAIALLAQGIAFIHSGQEFARTKQGNENSYNAGDRINSLDWQRADDNRELVKFVQKLTACKRTFSLLNLQSYDEIDKKSRIICLLGDCIAYELSDDEDSLVIIHNAGSRKSFTLEGDYHSVLDDEDYGSGEIICNALSTLVLHKKKNKGAML